MDNNKILMIAILLLLGFIFYENFLVNQNSNRTEEKPYISFQSTKQYNNNESTINLKKETNNNVELFRHLGNKHGTDKVTFHGYEYLYGIHLGPFRYEKINFLEIGLGCNMGYGPGKGVLVWKEFMPEANIYSLEFDAPCAEKFKNQTQLKKMFTGDQSDLNLLKNIGEEVGRFDVIVDDGGHSRKQQVNSLIGYGPI